MDPKDKTALITGATKGIGYSVAMALARAGSRLILVARDEERLAVTAEACRDGGAPVVHTIAADVATSEGLDRIVLESVRLESGFDILVNNAGIGDIKPITKVDDDEFDHTVAVNLRAPFMLTQAAVKIMRKRGGGQIVQIGSGLSYFPRAEWSLYAATKYGLRGFTECVRLEVAHQGIKVGTVAPGYTETHFFDDIPGDRSFDGALQPDDVAHAVMAMIMQSPRSDIKEITVRPPASP